MSAVDNNEEEFDLVTALKTDNSAMREEVKFATQQLNLFKKYIMSINKNTFPAELLIELSSPNSSSQRSSGDLQPPLPSSLPQPLAPSSTLPVSQPWPDSRSLVPLKTYTQPKRWGRGGRKRRAAYQARRNDMRHGERGGRGG
ncbi:hypothetical protein PV325_000160, partial [Microctonus aethiopoides]